MSELEQYRLRQTLLLKDQLEFAKIKHAEYVINDNVEGEQVWRGYVQALDWTKSVLCSELY